MMLTAKDKTRVRDQVSWIMMQTPPEFRKADRRAVIKDAIRRIKGVDTAARMAVEGQAP